MQNKYITLEEGINLIQPKSYSIMIKGVGAMCNLNCDYCYYIDKMRLYNGEKSFSSGEKPIMADSLLKRIIKEYIDTNKDEEICFQWHGGEPLLAGIDFFKRALDYQQQFNQQANGKICDSKHKIINSLQTNGTLLNEEWCKFFKKNNFLIGISLDGPEEIHNYYRKNKNGGGTFDRVMKGLELLKRYNVDFNILTVVNNKSEGRGKEIYRFFKSIGAKYIQFIPSIDYISKSEKYKERSVIVSPLTISPENCDSSQKAPWSVSSEGYGQFLIEIFDEWITNDVGEIFVQLFDMTLCSWCNIPPSLCSYNETCGNVLAIEYNGNVYSCDHFVYKENKIGNIEESGLIDMLVSTNNTTFGLDKRNNLSRECLRCKYYFLCKGECPKHRFENTLDGEKKFSLCEGIKMYYSHTEPYMNYMRDLLIRGITPSEIIPWARLKMLNKE